jgi:hypothetical protein
LDFSRNKRSPKQPCTGIGRSKIFRQSVCSQGINPALSPPPALLILGPSNLYSFDKDFHDIVYNSVFVLYQTERMSMIDTKNKTKKRKTTSKNKLIQEHFIFLAKELKINLNDVKKKAYKDTDDLERIFKKNPNE